MAVDTPVRRSAPMQPAPQVGAAKAALAGPTTSPGITYGGAPMQPAYPGTSPAQAQMAQAGPQPPPPADQQIIQDILASLTGQMSQAGQTQNTANQELAIQQLLSGMGFQGQLGSLGMQQAEGQQNLLQQTLGMENQQAGLNIAEQYNPIFQALQQQGYQLQGQGIQQALGQAANTKEQATRSAYGQAATSGIAGGSAEANNMQQIQYNYQQQVESLNRQMAQLGLSEKTSAEQFQEVKAQEGVQQQAINNMAQQIGFEKGDLTQRIDLGLANLNLSKDITAGQIAQAYQDQVNGVYNNLSYLLPYILQAGNIPNIGSLAPTGTP